jgi:hypothetical protein
MKRVNIACGNDISYFENRKQLMTTLHRRSADHIVQLLPMLVYT